MIEDRINAKIKNCTLRAHALVRWSTLNVVHTALDDLLAARMFEVAKEDLMTHVAHECGRCV